MTSISQGAFGTLHESLNELDLGYNDFQRFDDVFLDFRILQYLGLAHNRLGQAFTAGHIQLGHLFDCLQLVQVFMLLICTSNIQRWRPLGTRRHAAAAAAAVVVVVVVVVVGGMVKTATNQNGDRNSVLNEVQEDNFLLLFIAVCSLRYCS